MEDVSESAEADPDILVTVDVDPWIHALQVVQRQGRGRTHSWLRGLARGTGAHASVLTTRLGREVDKVGGRQLAAKLFRGRTVVDLGAAARVAVMAEVAMAVAMGEAGTAEGSVGAEEVAVTAEVEMVEVMAAETEAGMAVVTEEEMAEVVKEGVMEAVVTAAVTAAA